MIAFLLPASGAGFDPIKSYCRKLLSEPVQAALEA
jgi:hypothetical protein